MQINNPISFFDLETTGTDLENSRIVQICIIKMDENFNPIDKRKKLINPGVPIPKEATDVHGITDEMVKDSPMFGQLAKGIKEFLDESDLAGYNIINFDVPLLAEEFARCGINWPNEGTLFFDAMKIFHEKEKRDLTGAMKFYCNADHGDAHDAEADVLASIMVFRNQLKKYDDLREMSNEELAKFCSPEERCDLAGKIIMKDGEAVYSFGKDKGKSVEKNPGFGQWMLKQNFPTNTKNVIKKLIGIHAI